MYHQSLEYFVTESGDAIFPDQKWKVKPTAKFNMLMIQEDDTLTIQHSIPWIWKNQKWIIQGTGIPWLFAWKDGKTWCGVGQ